MWRLAQLDGGHPHLEEGLTRHVSSSHAYVCAVLYGAIIVSLMILFLRNWLPKAPSPRPEPNILNRNQVS